MVCQKHIDLLVLLEHIRCVSDGSIYLVVSDTLRQDPGRIWPGKKMAGRMGNKRITTQNLTVVRVDTGLDLIFVRGHVPGVDDAQVVIKDAKKKMISLGKAASEQGLTDKVLPKGVTDLPFPAGTAAMAKLYPPIVEALSSRATSPFVPRE
jgi:large subunit ribosomal protein L3